ncbi:MAG: hypothetical protein NTU41_14090, partial [Chloroflexi bacterium]|nr:hypothetical protein [Chloroflexota bacterium]
RRLPCQTNWPVLGSAATGCHLRCVSCTIDREEQVLAGETLCAILSKIEHGVVELSSGGGQR